MGDRTESVRETAARLNPPEDEAKVAADNSAKQRAIEKLRDARDLNLFKLAMGHDLGVGAYSRVRFGKLIVKELPQSLWPHIAVKIQDREVMNAQGYAANVEREIKILSMIKHPSIVGFIGSFTTEQSVFIAMEYLPNGDLQTILAAKGSLSTSATRFVTAEIILGLQHLHQNGIVYGDLKPENVLFDLQFHVKLSDFGSSRLSTLILILTFLLNECAVSEEEEEEGFRENRVEGTADYISPEVAQGLSRSTFASDAWAFGCVLFQLLAGHVPIVSSLDRHLEVA
ncbi:hypothetical protein GUITHDRAFT_80585 [Guillardia theta CCMP2712]|uniref:non-specific serine/threonine protein kinase n=1 Tax=Guillardia theta (strain CCMP2712) TaxID=905079 RepID=L1IDR1_GUITC|nr:hypothetical protein GUITHDRAFT_80585 [Guillardia theta CCMP2712]EKX34358.1 hypothetical protein GUITHDRAFT_80585 [Guillardia theta CCMP2712]|eukprot:XP_005821338.1 hypothetical protein GUITHDRAFT_80585 [Guillardia theta CCMP2712]